jgi:YVTN family beta-propeller protein
MKLVHAIALLVAALLSACGSSASVALPAGLHVVGDWPLSGSSTRFDYESLDPASHHLVIAHLGAGTVTIVDTRTHKIVHDIGNVADVHGVLVVPQLGRIYASATGDDTVAVFDSVSGRRLTSVPAGQYPDGIAYDPDDRRIAVSDEKGAADTIIDADTNRVLATVPLGGEAGNTQYDPVHHRFLVGVQTHGELAAIDPHTLHVVARYPTPGCDGPHGVLLDATRNLAFTACENNAKLLALDLTTMAVRATEPVGDGPDVLALDASMGRVYVAAESGILAVFRETGAGITPLGTGMAADNAHTIAVDPATHHVYLALPSLNGHPALRELAPAGVA